ncbi:MAG: hypothetical protein JW750_06890 [Anaerolineaceae bacterium]|nr:hypothetical protein [Anaerolineaceae bacterium]
MGETISLERIGTDGDFQAAQALYRELDGVVDAFGVGGAVLGLMAGERWYVLNSVQSLIKDVHQTPVVDGTGLKMTLESQVAQVLDDEVPEAVQPRKAMIAVALDRWGTLDSFINAGYETAICDLIFSFGINKVFHDPHSLKKFANFLMPVATRLPFQWLYPIGESQEVRKPKHAELFHDATVIAGDCHYVWKYMPDDMHGKIIVTNTTTEADRAFFKQSGVKYLLTTTPVLDGRSFGTNMMEAALVAAVGRKEPVNYGDSNGYFAEMQGLVNDLGWKPQLQELN